MDLPDYPVEDDLIDIIRTMSTSPMTRADPGRKKMSVQVDDLKQKVDLIELESPRKQTMRTVLAICEMELGGSAGIADYDLLESFVRTTAMTPVDLAASGAESPIHMRSKLMATILKAKAKLCTIMGLQRREQDDQETYRIRFEKEISFCDIIMPSAAEMGIVSVVQELKDSIRSASQLIDSQLRGDVEVHDSQLSSILDSVKAHIPVVLDGEDGNLTMLRATFVGQMTRLVKLRERALLAKAVGSDTRRIVEQVIAMFMNSVNGEVDADMAEAIEGWRSFNGAGKF